MPLTKILCYNVFTLNLVSFSIYFLLEYVGINIANHIHTAHQKSLDLAIIILNKMTFSP